MTLDANPNIDRTQQHITPERYSLNVQDPCLVAVYFFDGGGDHSAGGKLLSERLVELAIELGIVEDYEPRFSDRDLSYLDVACYRWDPRTRAAMVQFYVKRSQIWGVQFVLPVFVPSICQNGVPLGTAREAWLEVESLLDDQVRGLIEGNLDYMPSGSNVYWGNSRLYWALLEEDVADSRLAQEVQPIVGQDRPAQVSTGEYGKLWWLDRPTTDEGLYQTTWLLLSPRMCNDLVTFHYVFNVRFAVGEAYLCKARYMIGEYDCLAQDLRGDVQSVRSEVQTLLAKESPTDFKSERITLVQDRLRQRRRDLREVAAAYSSVLLLLPEMERLHWTVKVNLDNYEKMASEFQFWSHPVCQAEIEELQRILRRIEHDQADYRNLLQGLQTAIATVRAELEAARLDLEQKEAKRAKRQEAVLSILGLLLGISEIVALSTLELGKMATLLSVTMLVLTLMLLWNKLLSRAWQWLIAQIKARIPGSQRKIRRKR
jgi:hypothetical protein